MDFTPEQMFRAINALAAARVVMARYGEFYVEQGMVEIANKHTLSSVCGRGSTPDVAITDHFQQMTKPGYGHWVVVRAYALGDKTKRTAHRWNEFMWLEIDEAEERARVA